MDEEKRRFLVSLKPSDVRVSRSGGLEGKGEEGRRRGELGERLERFLAERDRVVGGSSSPVARELIPGAVLRGVVSVEAEEDVAATGR